MPRLLPPSDDNVAQAAAELARGGLVAFPTETVYGLGADTFQPAAIEKIFALKGRPLDNPLIAHVLDADSARRVAGEWDDRAARLARRFWPGPLTIVVPRGPDVPEQATAGWPTIAVRAPSHPVARALLAAFGGPISAPSANRSGGVSPTTAAHVAEDFPDADDLVILDGGPCAVGIESTVVDLTGVVPSVLRPGAVTVAELRRVLGEVGITLATGQAHAPGTSEAHYAPRTPAELVARKALPDRLRGPGGPFVVLCFEGTRVPPGQSAIVLPADPARCAARLYAALREADRAGAARILIEEPPEGSGLWVAVRDRLRRAVS